MFNLLNLLQTSVITMGVATATPIRNESISSENTENYSLTLSKTNSISTTSLDQQVNNTGLYDTGKITDERINISASNNYLNILGNEYTTKVIVDGNNNPSLMTCNLYRTYSEEATMNDPNGYSSTQKTYVLKITPYNFNVDTESNIVMQLTMTDTNWIYDEDTWIRIQHKYMQKNVYITTQNNWDRYIGKQLVTDTSKQIINEIEDPNYNFYYTKTTTTNEITTNTWTDTTEFELTPGVNNYIVINYVPLVQANWETEQGTYEYVTWQNVYCYLSTWNIGNITINGTGIIHTGQYEVIDIPGLMWQILTMPFAFVSQAFNLTLFPGTPYQVNISNLFLSIIAVFVFIWLIGFFLKMKG